jgi:hypothetical protein
MLQVPSVLDWRLSLTLLDEVALGGVGLRRGVFQTMSGRHRK